MTASNGSRPPESIRKKVKTVETLLHSWYTDVESGNFLFQKG